MFGRLFGRKKLEVPQFRLPAEDECVTTHSGLKYEVLREGSGETGCHVRRVKVHYAGWTLDGKLFDSSYERGKPFVAPLNGLIKGWQEALQLMNTGAVYLIVVPPQRAYGKRGMPPEIGPDETLVFQIELLSTVG